jgi:hypothetical protein
MTTRKILSKQAVLVTGSQQVARQLENMVMMLLFMIIALTGTPQAEAGELVVGDKSPYQVFGKYRFDVVIHLAGRLIVPRIG